jgi:hypothetical protein
MNDSEWLSAVKNVTFEIDQKNGKQTIVLHVVPLQGTDVRREHSIEAYTAPQQLKPPNNRNGSVFNGTSSPLKPREIPQQSLMPTPPQTPFKTPVVSLNRPRVSSLGAASKSWSPISPTSPMLEDYTIWLS